MLLTQMYMQFHVILESEYFQINSSFFLFLTFSTPARYSDASVSMIIKSSSYWWYKVGNVVNFFFNFCTEYVSVFVQFHDTPFLTFSCSGFLTSANFGINWSA